MRVLVIGGTGVIGGAVVAALQAKRHEVLNASRRSASHRVDMQDPTSIRALFKSTGNLDAIVVAAGGAAFKPMAQLSDADLERSIHDKLLGQVNVIRYGAEGVNVGGSITVTSGVLADQPMAGGAAFSLVNGGLESFTKAAALELAGKVRVNCVSPPWIAETLKAMGKEPGAALTASACARVYLSVLEGSQTGQVLAARPVAEA